MRHLLYDKIFVSILKYSLLTVIGVFAIYLGLLSHEKKQYFATKQHVPMPRNLKVIPPSPDLDPMIAAFSGVWEGYMDSIIPYKMVVTEVTDSKIDFAIGWGSYPEWEVFKGCETGSAPIVKGEVPTFHFFDKLSQDMTFIMGLDRVTMEVRSIYAEEGTYFDVIVFHKKLGKDEKVTLDQYGDSYITKPQIHNTPLPPDLEVIVPDESIAPELKALAGRWEGRHDGILKSVIVVKNINEKNADILISWESFDHWNMRAECFEGRAEVQWMYNGMPRLYYKRNVLDTFEFTLCPSGVVMEASGISEAYPYGGYFRKTSLQ